MKHAPAYSALSYTWDSAIIDSDDDEEIRDHTDVAPSITIGDELFTIRENLHDALTQFQAESLGLLWIDAICIDQNNLAERASQVAMMGDIYSRAERVIVWLGNDKKEVTSIQWLRDTWSHEIWSHEMSRSEGDTDENATQYNHGVNDLTPAKCWHEQSQFYCRRRWFWRSWVVQEFTLARELIFRCGDVTLDGEMLDEVATIGAAKGFHNVQLTPLSNFRDLFRHHKTIMQLNIPCGDSFNSSPSNTSVRISDGILFSWIYVTRSRDCTDQRDKVFSIFGIVRQCIPQGFIVAELVVDYTKSVDETYRDFVKATIAGSGNLLILSLVEDLTERRLQKLPRWCPDFSAPTALRPLETLAYDPTHSMQEKRINVASHLFTSRDQSMLQWTSKQGLCVSAKKVDIMASSSDLMPGTMVYPAVEDTSDQLMFSFAMSDAKYLVALFQFADQMDTVYDHTGQHRLEALWRTMIINDLEPSSEYPNLRSQSAQEHAADFASFFLNLCVAILRFVGRHDDEEYRQCHASLFGGLDRLARRQTQLVDAHASPGGNGVPKLPTVEDMAATMGLFRTWMEQTQTDPQSRELIDRANRFSVRYVKWCIGRKLFMTQQKWLGLTCTSAKPGDELWIFRASRVPFLMRPTEDDRYILVGEAYVHGMMHGELIDAPGGEEGFKMIELA